MGIVVGLTGMGGGALMTPALIFLGVGNASAVVTADLTAAAISRSAGAVDPRPPGLAEPDPRQVAHRRVGPGGPGRARGSSTVSPGGDPDSVDRLLLECIGFALLFAATTYALRIYLNLRRRGDESGRADPDPPIRPLVT